MENEKTIVVSGGLGFGKLLGGCVYNLKIIKCNYLVLVVGSCAYLDTLCAFNWY